MFFLKITGFDCGGEDILKVIKFAWQLKDVVLFIVPMALIVMVLVDFFKNVTADKEDDMKKNLNLAIKRILYCMALFLINPIVGTAISLLGDNGVEFMTCIDIATKDDLSKYKIDNTVNDYDVPTPDFSKPSGVTPSTGNDNDDDKEDNKESASTSTGYVILINPSHQVLNPTTSSNESYKTEKKSMYILARKLKSVLEENGYEVYLTPSSGDIDGSDGCWERSDSGVAAPNWATCGVKQVKKAIEHHNTDKSLYVALHSNASNGSGVGPYVYYANGQSGSQTFAKNLCASLTNVYKNNGLSQGLGSAANCVKTNASVGEPSLYYNNGGKGKAVLIEVGFHDNPTNQKFIEDYGDQLAKGMMRGIKSTMKK